MYFVVINFLFCFSLYLLFICWNFIYLFIFICFKCVWNWSLRDFLIVAFKVLSGNSNSFIISAMPSVCISFLFWVEIFLVIGFVRYFHLYPGLFGYVTRLWFLINSVHSCLWCQSQCTMRLGIVLFPSRCWAGVVQKVLFITASPFSTLLRESTQVFCFIWGWVLHSSFSSCELPQLQVGIYRTLCFFWLYFQKVELVDYMAVLFLIFWGFSLLFSVVAILI